MCIHNIVNMIDFRKTLKTEDDFYNSVMILNSLISMGHSTCAV